MIHWPHSDAFCSHGDVGVQSEGISISVGSTLGCKHRRETSRNSRLQRFLALFHFLIRPSGSNKALKLGTKGKEVDNFVDKLKSEGENIVATSVGKRSTEAAAILTPPVNMER